MRIDASTTVPLGAEDTYRIVCDMAYLIRAIDPAVISVQKQSEAPIAVGTRWIERIRVPLLPRAVVQVQLELAAFDPGRSLSFTFDSWVMSGTGTTTCTPAQPGTDVAVSLVGSVNLAGRFLYPFVVRDFRRREIGRMLAFKRKIETGELVPSEAETPPGF